MVYVSDDVKADAKLSRIKIPKDIREEMEHFKKTGIPRCMHCKKFYVNDVDSITGKLSPYLWKPACKCIKKDIRLGIG